MRSTLLPVVLVIAGLQHADLLAQEIHLRAGTLLDCTLQEPNFSSRSAKVGEPLTCQARPLREFGRVAIPHGAYFVGRLESYRDPGRFLGKGWIKLEFDRLILPNADVPILGKVISVAGFAVDADGRILGHGHSGWDALGWIFPPLWPVKLLTLPMRGPRPTLRGERRVTLRLLDDASIPPDAYLAGYRRSAAKEDAENAPKVQSWHRLSEGQTMSTPPVAPAPPRLQDRNRIQDRYQMPYRIEDRQPRSVEVWRGWVPNRTPGSDQNDVK
ncbi:MAG: hypothetical protein L0387_22420 [Acidobacteria bacterium]|nr:hypothetical protein [Acidobacteriota bacterium]MCI0624364.1 hypothetical protein [Acidobacteriota bacterium]MCI0723326.1 hypothetical protein [Acidobacteriota bacterium]